MNKLRVGILGATGAAGLEFVRALDSHPWFEIVNLYASKRSADRTLEEACSLDLSGISEGVRRLTVQDIDNIGVDLDLICSAIPSNVAQRIEAECAQHTPVVSTASAFRYENDVPVIITEVNADHYPLLQLQKQRGWNGWIAPGPNCTTVGLVMSLAPIYREVGIERVIMTSYQSVSGGGAALIQEWDAQRQTLIADDRLQLPQPFSDMEDPVINPKRIIEGNVIGHIEGEVEKVRKETRKVLGGYSNGIIYPAEFAIDCACVRVPTLKGHFEVVFVETKRHCSPYDLKVMYAAFNARAQKVFGNLPSSPKETIVALDRAPQPLYDVNLHHGMATVVGMIEPSDVLVNGLKYQVLSNNTEKGAAKGMIQVAEYFYSIGFLQPKH